MHKLTFFPLGNADSCLINLDNGRRILIDYANMRDPNSNDDLRSDLVTELSADFDEEEKIEYDVVAFTHADDDHIHGASEFFHLDHANKYQGDKRAIIKELWVPAAFVLEPGLEGDAKILRAEARHRLKEGYGIKVFSRPELLKEWLRAEDIELKDRMQLFVDAGSTVNTFNPSNDALDVFVHSPFAFKQEDKLEDRNSGCLVLHLSFFTKSKITKVIMGADSRYEAWKDIVTITKNNNNSSRLQWDVFKISHHCSYNALSDEKGKEKTEPIEEIQRLFEQGQNKGILISCSEAIPEEDTEQRPHKQAASFYNDVKANIEGKFVVTMEHPKVEAPEPIAIIIDDYGATLKQITKSIATVMGSKPAPRAGVLYD